MIETSFMHGWVALLGSIATIALVLTAFGIMIGIVKPADALCRIGAILGIVILLLLIPGLLASAWTAMPWWQQVSVIAIGICVLQRLRPRQQARSKKKE